MIWSRSASNGMCRSLIVASVSSRWIASSQELACTVTSEPSWPVLSAWSMSSVSPPRTSPTMMRSGRMRSELRTRSRIVTSPRPSTLGGRASSVTTCGCCSRSSALSSTVMIRSPGGHRGRERVEQRRLARAGAARDHDVELGPHERPQQLRRRRRRSSPCATSCSSVNSRGKRRMVIVGPCSASGGMITLTRSPRGQPRVDHRARLVDAAVDLRDDAVDRLVELRLVAEGDVRRAGSGRRARRRCRRAR